MKKTQTAISLFSYPKVNLALDILRKDESGYHEIQTVFHQLSEPFDEITIEPAPENILEVHCDNPKVPTDNTNTALKAAKLLKAHTGIKKGARIFIKKRIPLMSGLGGGASNAVATLCGLAKLWGISCCAAPQESQEPHRTAHQEPQCPLRRIADQIGMDCAFFFRSGTALGTHFGEKITPLLPLSPEIKFEIIDTGVEIFSRDAYSWVDLRRCGKNQKKTERLIEAIRAKDTKGIFENIHNDFEEFVFKKFPVLQTANCKLQTFLCGSGGCLVRVSYS
jgi:4-diphosphocytidyl-2-C-methyl-D-erythritol kinase